MCGVKSNETIHAGMYNSFGFESDIEGKHGDFFSTFCVACHFDDAWKRTRARKLEASCLGVHLRNAICSARVVSQPIGSPTRSSFLHRSPGSGLGSSWASSGSDPPTTRSRLSNPFDRSGGDSEPTWQPPAGANWKTEQERTRKGEKLLRRDLKKD